MNERRKVKGDEEKAYISEHSCLILHVSDKLFNLIAL